MKCTLAFGGFQETPEKYKSVGAAQEEYLRVARQLANYGQTMDAAIYLEGSEEPDYVLSLTAKGNLKSERV